MRALFTPPVFADEEKTYAARLLYALLLITLASSLLFAVSLVIFVPENALAQLPNTIVIGALCATMFFLVRRGRTRLASLLLISLIWIQSLVQAFLTGGIASPNFASHIAIVLGAGLLLGTRAGAFTMMLSLVAGYGLVVAEQGQWLPPTLASQDALSLWLSYVAIFAVVVILQALASGTIREALARARASEAQYRMLFEEAPEGICITDADNRLLMINPAAQHMLGYTQAEVMGRPTADFIAPESLAERPAAEPELLRAAGAQQRERKLIKKDGSVLPVFTSIRPMPDGRFHYIMRDATERKRTEDTLRESETLYRRAIEAAGAVPYYLDYATETYRFMGDGIFTLTGFAPEEMTLARWRTLVQSYQLLGDTAPYSVSEAVQRMRAGEIATWESDELIRARDGQLRWVLDTSVQVLDEQHVPHGSIGILQDITGRKRAEELRRVLYEVAEAVHTSPDLPALFRAIHQSLGQLMDVSNFYVALCVPGRPHLYTFPYAVSEQDSFEQVEDLSDSLTAYVTRTGKPALIDMATRETLLQAGEVKIVGAPAQLWLGAPLKLRDEVIGVVSVQSYTDPHRYNEKHIELLSFASNQIALATERKRADERERAITQGLRAVVEAADELIHLPDLDTFYRRAVELARETLKVERCSIFLLDLAQERQRGTYGTDELGHTVDERFLNLKSHGAALELMAPGTSRRWMIVEGQQVAWDTDTAQRRALDWGWIGCTLIRSVAQPLGIFYNDTAITHASMNEAQQEIIAIYCSVLGNIIERKRAETALAEQAAELRTLYHISGQLAEAATDVRALTQRIAEVVVAELKFVECGVWLLLPDGNFLRRAAYSGYAPDFVTFDLPLTRNSLMVTAATSGETIYAPDVLSDPRYLAGDPHTRSEFVVPLRARQRILGVLNVESPVLDDFSERQRRLLITFAEHAALALDNVWLVASLEKVVEEVQQLNAELEQRVTERTAQLEAALQELEAFSYSVSHDLRAPLRAMDGFSRLVLEDYANDLPTQAQHYLGQVRESAQRMGQLVDDLLAFSRLGRQALRFQALTPTELASLVHAVVDDLRAEAPHRPVEVVVGDLPACQADPALLKQVFINLLSNAFKFSQVQPAARIEVGSLPQPDGPAYYVRDNGVGFDMRYAHKLFGVFQRLHSESEFEGTGVGLAIVQRIINRHGGRIWVEAEVERGATFYFTLPAPRELNDSTVRP